jgi:serine-type D-Ala-D-Ala carboxypeptidase (penicillin-binding protein 5/6)
MRGVFFIVRGNKKQKRHTRPVMALILLIVIGVMGAKGLAGIFENALLAETQDKSAGSVQALSVASDTPCHIAPEQLYSPHAVLVRLSDQSILMQKCGNERIFPASLTKIMTVLVAIEELPNLREKVRLSDGIFNALTNTDASTAGFLPDEEVSVRDLLYGALLPSGAECCMELADRAAGSEQNFVEQMNRMAQELGMTSTHFENVTGLHNENHYTTVRDLAALLCHALQNKTFRAIFTTQRYSVRGTNRHPQGVTFHSTLFQSLVNPSVTGGKILGEKPGYTEQAGLCLATLAEIGSKEYVLVTAGAKGDHKTEQYDITDALTVYNSIKTE